MEVTQHPVALPACCIFCPGSVREKYIDTGWQFEWYGACYICDECIFNMGRMLGMLSKEQAELLIKSNSEAASENYQLRRKLSSLEVGLNALADAGFIDRNSIGSITSSEDDNTLFPDGIETPATGSSATETVLGNREGETSQPSDDEGLGILRSDERSNADQFSL